MNLLQFQSIIIAHFGDRGLCRQFDESHFAWNGICQTVTYRDGKWLYSENSKCSEWMPSIGEAIESCENDTEAIPF